MEGNEPREESMSLTKTRHSIPTFAFFVCWFFLLFSLWYCFNVSCKVLFNSATPWTTAHQVSLSSTISGDCSVSCPLSQCCHLTISSSATLFSFAFNLSQHQGLCQWVSSSHQVDKVLELQYQSFQWIFKVDFLENWLVRPPGSPRDS